MKTWKVVLIRCPQPLLYGKESGKLYSPNRSLTPEPTLAQLHGIINDWSQKSGVLVEVRQLDLRHPANGKIERVCYGELELPYLNEKVEKVYFGVRLEKVKEIIEATDFVGFTNNFTMSRRVVCDHIAWVREKFPKKEIWAGGRDLFPEKVQKIYARFARKKNFVVFNGHTFQSLPQYLFWRTIGRGDLHGVTIYSSTGEKKEFPTLKLTDFAGEKQEFQIPLPLYTHPEYLDYFQGSGEGQPWPTFGRFVHMTISIGCPNACGYCTTGYREHFLVWKNMEDIRRELDMYKSMHVKTVAIMDDNLLAIELEKLKEIMALINSYDFDIEYGNGLQLSLLAKHWNELKGPLFERCVSLYAPLEDLTRDKMYDKLDDTKSQLKLMQKIAKEKPGALKYVTMGVICGVPGHTKEKLQGSFLNNIKTFLEVFRGSGLQVGVTVFNYMPLAGTKFGDLALNSGRMVVADSYVQDPEVCSFGTTSYAPAGVAHCEVFAVYEEALNLNPAGKEFGLTYVDLQRLGEKAFADPNHCPSHWRVPGFHLRAEVN